MKIIDASYETMDIPDPNDRLGVLKHIESIGRICYKSEGRITDESCIKFIENLREKKHWAMLEHYIFTFSVPAYVYNDVFSTTRMTIENPDLIEKMSFIKGSTWNGPKGNFDYKYLISANATALNYLWACNAYKNKYTPGVVALCQFVESKIPELMQDPMDARIKVRGANVEGIRFVSHDEMKKLPSNIRRIHDFRSIKFTTSRAICMEYIRHRPASYAMESTRYCNYTRGKFGSQITVVKPVYYDINDTYKDEWEQSMASAEESYNRLIAGGFQPQMAREVLPQSIKADLVMTCRLDELHHFLDMRTSWTAHPQARQLAVPLLKQMITEEPEIYSDLKDQALFPEEVNHD